MNRPKELEKVSIAKINMDLLTSRVWRYQRLIIDGKEQTPPTHLIEFRKDGKYIEHSGGETVERPWKLSGGGRQVIINLGRTSSTAFIAVSESRLVLKGRTPMCTFVQRFEQTMVAVEEEEQLEAAV